MAKKRATSAGVRHPLRRAVLSGLVTVVGVALVAQGVMDMRASGKTGSPLLLPGVFAVLLGPLFFVHALVMVRVFRELRSGQGAIARWTVPAAQFDRFREDEQRVPPGSILANFYKPPRATPAEGVEVIFSGRGVLIGGGYFPLSTTGGRRVGSVRYIASPVPSIEFGMMLSTSVRTSSATTGSVRTGHTLRVPVAADALHQAGEVVRHYQALIGRS